MLGVMVISSAHLIAKSGDGCGQMRTERKKGKSGAGVEERAVKCGRGFCGRQVRTWSKVRTALTCRQEGVRSGRACNRWQVWRRGRCAVRCSDRVRESDSRSGVVVVGLR